MANEGHTNESTFLDSIRIYTSPVTNTMKTQDLHDSADYLTMSSTLFWIVCLVSGALLGFVQGFIHFGSYELYALRLNAMSSVAVASIWASCGVFVAISVPIVMLISVVVVFGEPLAGGSGASEVEAFLNGIKIPNFLGFRVLIVKTLGLMHVLASGLWIGRESPMIHIGAALTTVIGNAFNNVYKRIRTGRSRSGLTDHEKYDLASIGAALGIAAGFQSPLAGIVMILEGMSCYLHHGLIWVAFVFGILALFLAKLSNQHFVCKEVMCVSSENFLSFPEGTRPPSPSKGGGLGMVAILCSSVCLGFLWGCYCWLSGRLSNKFKEIFPAKSRFRKVLFSMLLMSMTCVVFVGMSYFTNCMEIPSGVKVLSGGVSRFSEIVCGNSNFFNPAAFLLMGPHEVAIRSLFSNFQENSDFPLVTLFMVSSVVVILIFFIQFSVLPIGLIIPAIFIGACVGRFFALVFGVSIAGDIAVCGAAASLVGLFRYPLAVTVMMMEVSSDASLALPILFSVIISRIISGWISESLSVVLMKGKGIKYLSHDIERVKGVISSGDMEISGFCKKPVDVVINKSSKENLIEFLRCSQHCYYPVTSEIEDDGNEVVIGAITRKRLVNSLTSLGLDEEVDVSRNLEKCSSFMVDERMSLVSCYRLFITNGLRHIVVVNNRSKKPVGMVTRHELFNVIKDKLL